MNAGQAVRLVVNTDGTIGVSIMASPRDHVATETFAFATFAEAAEFAGHEMEKVLADAKSAAKTAANLAVAEARRAPVSGKNDGETDLEFSKRVAGERYRRNSGQATRGTARGTQNDDTEAARITDSASRAVQQSVAP